MGHGAAQRPAVSGAPGRGKTQAIPGGLSPRPWEQGEGAVTRAEGQESSPGPDLVGPLAICEDQALLRGGRAMRRFGAEQRPHPKGLSFGAEKVGWGQGRAKGARPGRPLEVARSSWCPSVGGDLCSAEPRGQARAWVRAQGSECQSLRAEPSRGGGPEEEQQRRRPGDRPPDGRGGLPGAGSREEARRASTASGPGGPGVCREAPGDRQARESFSKSTPRFKFSSLKSLVFTLMRLGLGD